MNRIIAADSYKYSHFLQYPPRTEYVSSYIEARGVEEDFPQTNELVNAGLQAYLEQYMEKPITKADIDEAEEIAALRGDAFNRAGWEIILNEYGGFFPLQIQALPEGMVFPVSTAQVQVINTDPRLYWLTSFVETSLLRAIWYPTTVATLAREIKKACEVMLDLTSDNPEVVDFMLHDFGPRGVSSGESSAIGGMGHLISFRGTDNLEAIKLIRDLYSDPSKPKGMPAFSVNAAEHSTITSWINHGGEEAAYSNMIDQFGGPGKIYACVSDSYDIYNAVANIWGGSLKEKVLAKGGRLVVRPDSGYPADVVLKVVQILGEKFGYTVNSKGFKVLHPSVRVIQGDGVNYWSIIEILGELHGDGWSAENVVFGMGGALLQKVNRDTLKYAMKASAIDIDGKWYDVFKDPITDPGKRSKKGRLAVTPKFETISENDITEGNLLKTVWVLGKNKFHYDKELDFEKIRERAKV